MLQQVNVASPTCNSRSTIRVTWGLPAVHYTNDRENRASPTLAASGEYVWSPGQWRQRLISAHGNSRLHRAHLRYLEVKPNRHQTGFKLDKLLYHRIWIRDVCWSGPQAPKVLGFDSKTHLESRCSAILMNMCLCVLYITRPQIQDRCVCVYCTSQDPRYASRSRGQICHRCAFVQDTR